MSASRSRLLSVLWVLACGCGTLASGPGQPENAPSSGLGPSQPYGDDTGLSWSAPFMLADPAQAFSHPSVLADGDALELYIEATQGLVRHIVHARAPSFEAGFGETDTVLDASLPWHAGAVGSPAIVLVDDARYLFYLADGKLGVGKLSSGGGALALRQTPLYADPAGAELRSVAAARIDDRVRLVLLIGDALQMLELPISGLEAATNDGAITLATHSLAIELPPWATAFLDVGLRIDRTPTGRFREDLFFGAALPSTADLGAQPSPSAIGAASRYLAELAPDPRFELVASPILSGSPAPRGPTTVAFRGGVLLFYTARTGARDALGVSRHP